MTIAETKLGPVQPSIINTAADQLFFLFAQLDPTRVEAIVERVEFAVGAPQGDAITAIGKNTRRAVIEQAVARLLYAIAGLPYEDILFALTYAETQAMIDGACDEIESEVHYC
ncbi:hypothetical protein [Kordiimonas aestuarii]|uniref:hypothetical protein n=1 Tax=Kordiimonas aestuarii TaxID=1005925 RepID=UPI0021D0D0B5|nr:hypothetical protein [Kordiimonas aestuarii]